MKFNHISQRTQSVAIESVNSIQGNNRYLFEIIQNTQKMRQSTHIFKVTDGSTNNYHWVLEN
jgi:hypothetical protein